MGIDAVANGLEFFTKCWALPMVKTADNTYICINATTQI
jgi:hypothetical protein